MDSEVPESSVCVIDFGRSPESIRCGPNLYKRLAAAVFKTSYSCSIHNQLYTTTLPLVFILPI